MADRARPSLAMHAVVIDCGEFEPLIAFWFAALGYVEWFPPHGQFAGIKPPERDGRLPVIFQKVHERKVVKNRVHIDFEAADRVAEVARLVALGATALEEHSLGEIRWTRVADPEGNEFCVAGS